MNKCIVCDKEFPLKYRSKGIKQVCCSRACSYKHRGDKEVICKTCKKPFRAHGLRQYKEYCSLACVQREPCQTCGEIITGRAKFQSGERKFCSRKCAGISRIINGKAKVHYMANGFAQTIKKFGKICCEICNQSNIDFLVVHHIDENRKNNEPNNLQTLCANCHHQLHWKNSRNRINNIEKAKFIANNFTTRF